MPRPPSKVNASRSLDENDGGKRSAIQKPAPNAATARMVTANKEPTISSNIVQRIPKACSRCLPVFEPITRIAMNKNSTLATHKSMIIGQRLRQRVLMVGFTVCAGSEIIRDFHFDFPADP